MGINGKRALEGPGDCTTAALALDAVDHPAHYTQGTIECIDAIEAALGPEEFRGYLTGNLMKYVWRYRHKNGLEDLRKAQWYLDRLTALL